MLHVESVVCMREANMKAICKRIKEARKVAGISAMDLACFIGICKEQMSIIENGKV